MTIAQYTSSILLAGLAVAAIGLVGCTNAPSQPESSPTPADTAQPGTLPAAPPPDTGGVDSPALDLASLPIGGGFEDSSSPTCVLVNWIPQHPEQSLPAGVTVAVTGAAFDPEVYNPVDAGCSNAHPSCFHFVFGAGETACGLGVEPTGLSSPTGQTALTVTGTVVCAHPRSSECTTFFDAVSSAGGSTIEVDAPTPADTSTPTP